MAGQDQDIPERAEDLFVWRSAIAEGGAGRLRLAFHDLHRYLTDPTAHLDVDQQRLLFRDARLRSDFQRLKADLCARHGHEELPRAAAAADDGGLTERPFRGGRVRLVTSERNPRQVYLIIEVDQFDRTFAALILEAQNGDLAKLQLGSADERGVAQVLLDLAEEEHDRIVRMIRDPHTVGMFI